ncbi:uncharacterized protein LOC115710697 [Cannabis sativa]|uniref:uncharacterized protein LOC115710697 n=1 Tax=Cannabis sativa TaxID=3483 RepID=UPI0011DFCCFF|nr:uncharacterized protein LOC115710697 [Cannabis sativa]
MPYSIYLQLGLGELKPTSVVLQLADRSVKKPRGIVEDVLIQIDKFYYPVDFLILDTQSEVNLESKIPIILGRPFLAIANALINCRNGLMKISFGNMTLEVNVFNIGKQPPDNDECFQSFLIDTLISEEVEAQYTSTHLNDLFEISEISESGNTEINPEVINQLPTKRTMFWNPIFEGLPQDRETPKPSTVQAPQPNLAQLPKELKHVFLGANNTFPVIISSTLNATQEQQLINVLTEQRGAIGWR